MLTKKKKKKKEFTSGVSHVMVQARAIPINRVPTPETKGQLY